MKKLLVLSTLLLAFGSVLAQTHRKTATKTQASPHDQSTMQKEDHAGTTTTKPTSRKGTTVKGKRAKRSAAVEATDKANPNGARSTTGDRTGTNGIGTTTSATGTAPSPKGKMPAN